MHKELQLKAKALRRATFQAFIEKGEAHLGGSFSIIETLIALFERTMVEDDKFILSKGHASFPLCLLLREKGCKTKLTTHLEIDPSNGIHCTTGSLGHGLPIAMGMAFARKKLGKKGRIIVMISDGECQEGTTWESLLIAAKHKLDNLLLLVDNNQIQALDRLDDVLPLGDLRAKFEAFNWKCDQSIDGHSFEQLIPALASNNENGVPSVVILDTVKGKGIPEFENDPVWHARKVKDTELKIGQKALGI
jgi:transketolase